MSGSVTQRLRLKDYEIAQFLGAGNFGQVFKARGKSGSRPVVAVKCVPKAGLSKAEQDNLITEISLLKKLKEHPHVVRMIDFFGDAANIYIVMEYCGGGDLSQLIKTKVGQTLPEDVCKRYLQQLASALRFLHENNIAHLDLKPSNILLYGPPRKQVLKLADFGMAVRLSSTEEVKTTARGSPLYMAPEMIIAHRYDARADLWSVGVILYECLFGQAPYKSETTQELMERVKEDRPVVIPRGRRKDKLSAECYDILERLLQRDPEKRITFDGFFAHAFLDLEHIPNEQSLTKAICLAEEAVEKDRRGDLEGAKELYLNALNYFLPVMKQETSEVKRQKLRTKIERYLSRVEQIKQKLDPSSATEKVKEKLVDPRNASYATSSSGVASSSTAPTTTTSKLQRLISLSSAAPQILTGLEIGQTGEDYDREGRVTVALDKYESALRILLPLVKSEPEGSERKKLLAAQVDKWLSRAEVTKKVLDIQEQVLRERQGDSIDDGGGRDVAGEGRGNRRHLGFQRTWKCPGESSTFVLSGDPNMASK